MAKILIKYQKNCTEKCFGQTIRNRFAQLDGAKWFFYCSKRKMVYDFMDENKKKALDEAILKIQKDFGKGAVMRLGDPNAIGEVEVVPTGALSLDIALGLGGIPNMQNGLA